MALPEVSDFSDHLGTDVALDEVSIDVGAMAIPSPGCEVGETTQ